MTTEAILLGASIALTSLGIVLFYKRLNGVQPLVNLLLLTFVTLFMQSQITPAENSIVASGVVISLCAINVAAAHFLQQKKWKWVIPIVSILLLLIVGKTSLLYGEYTLDFSKISILSLILMGFGIGLVSQLLTLALKRFFEPYHHKTIAHTAQLILLGLFTIAATFLVSWYGVLLLAIGFFIYNAYAQHKNDVFVLSIALIAAIGTLLPKFGLEGVDLTIGKVIAGLIVGVGVVALAKLALKSHHVAIKTLLLILAVISFTILFALNNIHPAYGGPESFVAAIFGIAIHLLIAGQREVANLFVPLAFSLSLLFPSTTEPSVIVDSVTQDTKAAATPAEPEGLDASQLTGKFSIDQTTSLLNFQLGPKGGVTKGAIKNFEGTVDFGNSIETAKFDVKLQTKNLTTFNSMRDESVLGGAYLNQPKFPLMQFKSSTLEKKDDGYLLKGNFTLLGKTHEETVILKYLGEKEGKHQFFGKSSLDRTNYGMVSSPQEGNVIDFTFTMELK